MRIAVIGGGPAGIFAAINAKNPDNKVVLFERNKRIGSKMLITGKGRCNITNSCTVNHFVSNIVSNPKFLFSALSNFSPQYTIDFFKNNGLELVAQRGNRVFPKSEKSSEVVAFLEKYLNKISVDIRYNTKVDNLENINGFYYINNNYQEAYDSAIMAIGGLSYPKTGSDGHSFDTVKKLGHKIVEFRPALVGITTRVDKYFPAGLSLKNIKFIIEKNKKIIFSDFGEMLFTHVGISGPVILSASSMINKEKISSLKAYIDLKPALSSEQIKKRILSDFENNNKMLKNSLDSLLPKKLIPYFISKTKINPEKQINQITKEEREKIEILLKHFDINILSLEGIEKAIITSGGVDVRQVNPSTMESKMLSNLFFAGEMLDVDALTGGYNMQIAISTGSLAGKSAKNKK